MREKKEESRIANIATNATTLLGRLLEQDQSLLDNVTYDEFLNGHTTPDNTDENFSEAFQVYEDLVLHQ